MSQWIDVAAVDAVADDEVLAIAPGGKPIALIRSGGDFHALYDLCSHGQARLSDGFVEDGTVECPLHQGLICVRTGQPRSAPITAPVATFPVRVVDGRVEVLV